jgi:hypothetical protein
MQHAPKHTGLFRKNNGADAEVIEKYPKTESAGSAKKYTLHWSRASWIFKPCRESRLTWKGAKIQC